MPHKGYKQTEEHIEKLSLARFGKKRSEEVKLKMKHSHKPFSKETRRRMSEAKKGIPLSEETRQKMRKPHKELSNKVKQNRSKIKLEYYKTHRSPYYGKKHSEETRNKIILGRINNPLSKEARKRMSKNNCRYWKGKKMPEEIKQKIRISVIEYKKKNNCGIFFPMIGRYEKLILDELQNRIGYNIVRQFFINGYFLDGYIPEINLAIEIDEEHHYKKQVKEKDINKQNNIINSLGCNFLRIRVSEVIKEGKLNNELLMENIKW